eukprot:TRINITY_DN13125_c0_g2_i1.p1 TRINITY_DN13125_c0_g2~~TRINITY_DN13125_c0_g2_i1.p1  ORF type:complete len:450 (+),score=59.04 TRINITY_DN13125_c0_g2_i1:7-1356(+)
MYIFGDGTSSHGWRLEQTLVPNTKGQGNMLQHPPGWWTENPNCAAPVMQQPSSPGSPARAGFPASAKMTLLSTSPVQTVTRLSSVNNKLVPPPPPPLPPILPAPLMPAPSMPPAPMIPPAPSSPPSLLEPVSAVPLPQKDTEDCSLENPWQLQGQDVPRQARPEEHTVLSEDGKKTLVASEAGIAPQSSESSMNHTVKSIPRWADLFDDEHDDSAIDTPELQTVGTSTPSTISPQSPYLGSNLCTPVALETFTANASHEMQSQSFDDVLDSPHRRAEALPDATPFSMEDTQSSELKDSKRKCSLSTDPIGPMSPQGNGVEDNDANKSRDRDANAQGLVNKKSKRKAKRRAARALCAVEQSNPAHQNTRIPGDALKHDTRGKHALSMGEHKRTHIQKCSKSLEVFQEPNLICKAWSVRMLALVLRHPCRIALVLNILFICGYFLLAAGIS